MFSVECQSADADRRRRCLFPRPAIDALHGAAAQVCTELDFCFLRIVSFFCAIMYFVSVVRTLCDTGRFWCHFAMKWLKRKRLRVRKVTTCAMFAFCISTAPLCAKSQVCTLVFFDFFVYRILFCKVLRVCELPAMRGALTWCMQSHSCAVSISGAASCWGSNSAGQVMPLEMLFDGAALCCGGEIYFMADLLFFLQLGDGSTTNRPTPVAVSGLSSGVAVIASGVVRLFVTAVQMLIV
jgi:hypothetical protein